MSGEPFGVPFAIRPLRSVSVARSAAWPPIGAINPDLGLDDAGVGGLHVRDHTHALELQAALGEAVLFALSPRLGKRVGNQQLLRDDREDAFDITGRGRIDANDLVCGSAARVAEGRHSAGIVSPIDRRSVSVRHIGCGGEHCTPDREQSARGCPHESKQHITFRTAAG